MTSLKTRIKPLEAFIGEGRMRVKDVLDIVDLHLCCVAKFVDRHTMELIEREANAIFRSTIGYTREWGWKELRHIKEMDDETLMREIKARLPMLEELS